ncbi:MAG: hypothetical protein ACO2PN_08435 [Pyrobaculum sp.]|jgi:hypothetical protein
MFTLFKKVKAEAPGAAGLRGATYRVYTASDKPSADRYGGTDHPPRRRYRTRDSPRRQPPANNPGKPATHSATG